MTKPRNGLCKPEAERSERRYQRAKYSLETVFLNSFPAVVSSSEESVVRGNFHSAASCLSERKGISGQLSVQSVSTVLLGPGNRGGLAWPGPPNPVDLRHWHSFLKAWGSLSNKWENKISLSGVLQDST